MLFKKIVQSEKILQFLLQFCPFSKWTKSTLYNFAKQIANKHVLHKGYFAFYNPLKGTVDLIFSYSFVIRDHFHRIYLYSFQKVPED